MLEIKKKIVLAVTITFALAILPAYGQNFGTSRPTVKNDPVQYLFPEQVSIPAGKSTPIELHFRIAQGLHINSHTPSDDYLIPTTFSIPDGAGVHLEKAAYPVGADITLPADPKTKLSVYTGEFIIQASIVSKPGNHLIEAKLHYQACNDSQCLPPRTIAVAIDVIGK